MTGPKNGSPIRRLVAVAPPKYPVIKIAPRMEVCGDSKVSEAFDDLRRLHQFQDGTEDQEQHRQRAYDVSGPERPF
jgi:hypothetical protein